MLEAAILLASVAFFVAHFIHLSADFPNHSPWMDWSKYTDEGWYGDAAIRYFQLGHWNVPGDFNPAAALPVWPAIEAVVFHFTGVSLVAARALTVCVFGLILFATYLLLRRWQPAGRTTLAPALAVLLLAVSPFCFVFTRIAILEPMLVLLILLALLTASAASQSWPSLVALGLLLPAAILTKTTALFVFPAIAWLLLAATGYNLRRFTRAAVPVLLVSCLTWGAYFLLAVRPHYLEDYRYLFSANAYTGITAATALSVIHDTFLDGLWIGTVVYPLSLLSLLVVLVRFRWLRDQPLLPCLILWAGGYLAFLAYHNNLQPRYYLVVALPLTMLVALVLDRALRSQPLPAVLAAVALAAIALPDAAETIQFLRNPEYTLVDAAHNLAEVVRADPTHSPLLLSISGSEISLMTGLHSICDDFGTLELADRVQKFRPGWYAAWNEIDDDKMDALAPLYHPVRVATFPAMDDPERNLLILYRLDARDDTPHEKSRRKPIPRPLQTKMGQQPSVNQLEH